MVSFHSCGLRSPAAGDNVVFPSLSFRDSADSDMHNARPLLHPSDKHRQSLDFPSIETKFQNYFLNDNYFFRKIPLSIFCISSGFIWLPLTRGEPMIVLPPPQESAFPFSCIPSFSFRALLISLWSK